MFSLHNSSIYLEKPRMNRGTIKQDKQFILRHYGNLVRVYVTLAAGDVSYNVDGFLEYNKDNLYPHLVAMLRESSSPFLLKTIPEDAGLTVRTT